MSEAVNARAALAGKRIVVTRARHQAAGWEAVIRDFGAAPVAYPCLAIAPPINAAEFERCLRELSDYDWLALSSGNVVRAVAERARALTVLTQLRQIKIAALGPSTASEVERQIGKAADFVPAAFSAGGLAREMPIGKGSRILLPQSDLADDKTANIMRSRGALVAAPVAYRTVIGSGGADLPALIAASAIDALTFASPSAVRFFRQRCRAPAALDLPALCLGEATASAAANAGFRCTITSPEFGLRALMTAFANCCPRRD
ncbi:MAG: uroporphyrinogen-III synthase [Chloroflexi bacterium]|nr:uroporphyrinogen-III synthase [Chloroflexota bacterium]